MTLLSLTEASLHHQATAKSLEWDRSLLSI
jgi:hypothetical protein